MSSANKASGLNFTSQELQRYLVRIKSVAKRGFGGSVELEKRIGGGGLGLGAHNGLGDGLGSCEDSLLHCCWK